jgi:hypothetical protein
LNGFGATAGINGRGVVLFSPQLIRAFIVNFESVVKCQEKARENTWSAEIRSLSGSMESSFGGVLQRFSDDKFGQCFGQPVPRGAVAAKLTWSRVGGPPTVNKVSALANYDTSVDGMRAMLEKSGTWRIGDQSEASGKPRTVSVPGYDGIYRVRADNGHEWALTGIHLTTRETKEWVWVSLWWGGDSFASDFGADRPALCGGRDCGGLEAYYAPWNAYKMCVVTAWREGDAVMNITDPDEFERAVREPSVSWAPGIIESARATRASYTQGKKAPDGRYYTWCSNPFIEFESGMADSNCIGCHQFAVPGGAFNQTEHNHFDKMNKDFPADFLWSFDSGVNRIADRILGVTNDASLRFP